MCYSKQYVVEMALPALPSVLTKSQWPFSPQIFPSCLVWLDIADSSTYVLNNQRTITSWRNKGFAGGDATSTSGTFTVSTTTPRTLTVPSGASMTLPSITFTQPSRSFCMVMSVPILPDFDYDPNEDLRIIGGKSPPCIDIGFLINRSALYIIDINSNTNILFASLSIYSTRTQIVFGIIQSPDSSILSGNFYINGNNVNYYYSGSISLTGITTTQTIGSSSNKLAFTLNEFMMFDGTLLDKQRQQLEGYMAAKWGLQTQLKSSHPYSNIPVYNRPFQPVDIGGCGLWFDAADKSSMVLSGSSVIQWNDKSGNGRNATSGSTRPAYSDTGFNGSYPGIIFSETASVLTTAAFSPVPSLTANEKDISIFVVYNVTSFSGQQNAVFSGAVDLSSNGTQSINVKYGDILNLTGSSVTIGTQLFSFLRSGATSLNTNYIFMFGNLVNNSQFGNSISNSSQTFRIGPSFNSSLAELIIFNNCLQLAQRQQVESYLAQKWGLVSKLTTGHPGKLLPPFSVPFTPKSIINDLLGYRNIQIQLWLDGNDPFGNGTKPASGTVFKDTTYWVDKAKAYDYSIRSYNDPVYNITNGYGSLLLNSSAYFETYEQYYPGGGYFSAFQKANPFSIFIVAKMTSERGRLYAASLNINSGYYPNDSGTAKIDISEGSDAAQKTPSPVTTNIAHIHSITAGPIDGTINVTMDGSGSPYITSIVKNISFSELFIGKDMSGNIYEFIIYEFSVSTFQQQQIEGYLAWKWGLVNQLPSSHAYAKFAP